MEAILFQKEARKRLLHGAQLLMESVKGTLGPCGHHVLIQKEFDLPLITNDGVTIAKSLHVSDPYEQMGIQILLDSAGKTNENGGDGTTTSILLAYELLRQGFQYMEKGGVASAFVQGMEKAAQLVEAHIRKKSKSVAADEIVQIASISAKSKEIGALIAKAIREVSDPRCIVCEQGSSYESKLRIQEGMELNAALLSPYFLPQDESSVTLRDVDLLISNETIDTLSQLDHFIAYAYTNHRPLIVLCGDMDNEVLGQLIYLHMQKKCNVMVCKAPSFGTYQQDMLEDLALVCKGKAWCTDMGKELSEVSFEDLGKAKEIIVRKHSLQIFAAHDAAVDQRIAVLKKQLPECTKKYDQDHINRRIARLEGKIAVLEIGGYTRGEIEEKRMRCEDALQASFAAMEEGIVPGGGLALIQSYRTLQPYAMDAHKDRQAGMNCVFTAILKPFLQLVENNYESPAKMLEQQLENEENIGYDVWKEEWCDLMENGVIDPAKVVIEALRNAVSVAGLLIRCDVAMLNASASLALKP